MACACEGCAPMCKRTSVLAHVATGAIASNALRPTLTRSCVLSSAIATSRPRPLSTFTWARASNARKLTSARAGRSVVSLAVCVLAHVCFHLRFPLRLIPGCARYPLAPASCCDLICTFSPQPHAQMRIMWWHHVAWIRACQAQLLRSKPVKRHPSYLRSRQDEDWDGEEEMDQEWLQLYDDERFQGASHGASRDGGGGGVVRSFGKSLPPRRCLYESWTAA
jgi:hypothetical protein